MASSGGDKEHRMLFDIRGRRKNVVKVIYAVLAVLMGLSLFLTVGPGLNIGELFSDNTSSSGEAAKPYEEQAERIEAKLRKDPEDPQLLVSLTRARVTAGNSLLSIEPDEEDLTDAMQQYQLASASWSEYLDATKEPSAGVAQLVAPTFVALAERSRSYQEAVSNIKAASEAAEIVAEQRPTLNSLSTLALYTFFTGDFAAAEKAQAEAKKFTKAKFEEEQLDKQMKEVKERAEKFQQEIKRAEAAEKAGSQGGKGQPESLENPTTPLSGAFGSGGQLGE